MPLESKVVPVLLLCLAYKTPHLASALARCVRSSLVEAHGPLNARPVDVPMPEVPALPENGPRPSTQALEGLWIQLFSSFRRNPLQ